MECNIVGNHIGSFNYMVDGGLERAVTNIHPERFKLKSGEAVEIWVTGASLGFPTLDSKSGSSLDTARLMPSECRQRGITYRGRLKLSLSVTVDGHRLDPIERVVGDVPIMLRSKRCHLAGLDSNELMRRGEEPHELGGYFIVNGSEKVVRCLVLLRRNFPLALVRPRFRERGKLYTEFGVVMRCCRENHASATITLHYLESGCINLSFAYRRESFFVPLIYILKALMNRNDQMIYKALMRGRETDDFWRGCVMNMLHMAQDDNIVNHSDALKVLGAKFRVAVGFRLAPWETDSEVTQFLLKNCIAVHLDSDEEKFDLLVLMAQKLIALVRGEIMGESPDNPQFQEAGLSGHILLMLLREKVEMFLARVHKTLDILSARKKDSTFAVTSKSVVQACGSGASEITRGLEYFLATGNLVSTTGLGLGQQSGYSVIAERINQLRFLSHFRAIHRGSQFQDSRTPDVRKLRPEAWGYICPVHTPDGAPCGLLNHLTSLCHISTHLIDNEPLKKLLKTHGLLTFAQLNFSESHERLYPVLCDGRHLGYVRESRAEALSHELRRIKVDAKDKRVPDTLEITLIKFSPDVAHIQTQFPGLYLFTEPGRLLRPVRNVEHGVIEQIGIFEQVYLSVCIEPEEAESGVCRHQELAPNALFSLAANLIPYPDHNQSPRNVYQCQMGKQTMGTAVHAWHSRADNKMYRLMTPQSPLVKPEHYDVYGMDNYPLGTNAIVAVISYTGYDMEDAMVINRSSYERGFGHGSVYKCERINLRERGSKEYFARKPDAPEKDCKMIDQDGLPVIACRYREGDVYCSVYNPETQSYFLKKYKSSESATVTSVRVIVDSSGTDQVYHALVQWCITRNPIIGDKFASRHGQKGINSFLWPIENMPFSETGMVPDILFNPHGYPSRMTIGMMIESMAGKSAATHAWRQDATPFVFSEEKPAINYFGEQLEKAGFNYFGTESLYSGIDGKLFEVQIFFGIIYYQRLRHMVADKYQVRATGPIDTLTHQPVQGRKRAGGIRFGEMERDALIAHGASFVLQDRLFNCSDKDVTEICKHCESLISPEPLQRQNVGSGRRIDTTRATVCRTCNRSDGIKLIEIPYVFRYLTAELASMNIKTVLKLKNVTEAFAS